MLRVVAIVGATAVGKTALSLEIADALNAEIINADSMQLYRGMNIGTAKLPFEQRQGIAHHMLDVLDVTEQAAVSDYQLIAREIIDDIHSRGKRAVVVGGSGLYVSALFEEFTFPGNDPQYRNELEELFESEGVPPLYRLLQEASPDTAVRIGPSNHRRIIRALEIIRVTGLPPQDSITELKEIVPSLRFGLRRTREELDQRINHRVDLMFDEGLVAETSALLDQGLREGRNARQALGYAQVLNYLDGKSGLDETIDLTKSATRKFARRQDSWFNRDSRISWRDAADAELAAHIVNSVRAQDVLDDVEA